MEFLGKRYFIPSHPCAVLPLGKRPDHIPVAGDFFIIKDQVQRLGMLLIDLDTVAVSLGILVIDILFQERKIDP